MTDSAAIRIIVVDDHPVVRFGLVSILSLQPDMVVVADVGSGEEACAICASRPADVVLMDLRLPGMSGADAIRAMRQTAPDLRFIVLTTYDGDEDIAKALEVRVYTVLVGRGGQVPIPVQVRDPMTGEVRTVRTMADVQIDEKLLETIAARTGAEFFRATDPQSLRRIFERIDALEKTEIRQATFRRYRDLFPPVLYLTTVCLAMAGLLWLGGLRVIPA